MSGKRPAEKQMRKEDVDDGDEPDDDDEPQHSNAGFRMADESVLKERKIVKAVRRSGASQPEPSVSSTAGVFGAAFGSTFNTAPPAAAPAPPNANPFATINLFAPAHVPAPVVATAPSTTDRSTADSSNDSEYKKKMRKLNQSLLSWMDKQITEHPTLVWKEGIQDYLKYCMSLAEKYPEGKSLDNATALTMSSNAKSLLNGMPTDANASNPFNTSNSIFSAKSLTVVESSTKPAATFDFSAKPKDPTASFVFGGSAPAASATASTAAAAAPFSFSGSTHPNPAPLPAIAPIFGSAAPSATAAPPAAFSFSFGGSTASSSASTNIFGAPAAQSIGLPPIGGGIFGSAPKATPIAAADEDEGGDDEGEPIMAPEKVLKNEQDTDEILHDVPCKLFRFSTEQKEWMDLGKGNLRVTRAIDTKKQRILIRNTMGKIAFNAFFFKGMKFDKLDKNKGLRFTAVADPAVGPQGFMLRLKEEHVADTLAKLDAGVASLI